MHPFLLSSLALAVALCGIGLTLARVSRLSSSVRHSILSLAFLTPLIAIGIAWFDPPNPFVRATSPTSIDISLTPAAVPPPAAATSVAWPLWIWIAGVALFTALTLRSILRWSAVARRATILYDARFENLASGLPVDLAVSNEVSEPMVVGILRPHILLPAGFAQELGAHALTSVYEHELAHVRRHDNALALVHEVVCALFWFDPLHWIARRRLLELRERACDERVLESGCDARAYAGALARACHAAVESAAVACMSGFQVRERMESIMTYASIRDRFLSSRVSRWSAIAAAAVIVTTFAVIAPAPPVIAADAPDQYRVEVFLDAGEPRMMVVRVVAPDGQEVLNSSVRAGSAQPVSLSTQRDGRTFNVTVAPPVEGENLTVLEVRNESGLLQHTEKRVKPRRMMHGSTAEPITVRLEDADIHDVARTFSQLTGRKIEIDPTVARRVTIDYADIPWDEALRATLRQAGLVMSYEPDGTIRGAIPEDTYQRVGGNVKAPKLISAVEPVYTAEAKEARISGIVIVETQIDENGNVTGARVLKPLPMGLDQAALDAVQQWKFEPGTVDGKPVPVIFNLTINFRVE